MKQKIWTMLLLQRIAWKEFAGRKYPNRAPGSPRGEETEFVQGKPTSIYRIKYERRESCTGRAPNEYWSHICLKKLLKTSKKTGERFKQSLSWTQTGLGKLYVITSTHTHTHKSPPTRTFSKWYCLSVGTELVLHCSGPN